MKLLKKTNHMIIYECDNDKEMAEMVGNNIVAQIKSKPDSNIGLQSGFSIVPTCDYLIRNKRRLKINFKKTNFFAICEYGVIDFGAQMTHTSFMLEHFYKPFHIKHKHIHIPNEDSNNFDFSCYDRKIWSDGGIDLAIISVGTTGELGFNAARTSLDSLTHCVKLPIKTIKSESHCYQTDERLIPKIGITMGLYTIFNCRHIILIASGVKKAEAISKLLEGKQDINWPLTSLLTHHNIEVYLDKDLINALPKYMKVDF